MAPKDGPLQSWRCGGLLHLALDHAQEGVDGLRGEVLFPASFFRSGKPTFAAHLMSTVKRASHEYSKTLPARRDLSPKKVFYKSETLHLSLILGENARQKFAEQFRCNWLADPDAACAFAVAWAANSACFLIPF